MMEYYKDMFSTGAMQSVFSDVSCLQNWLQVEIALFKAQIKVGIIPQSAHEGLQQALKIENLEMVAMKTEFIKGGFPILPFLDQLIKSCDADIARWIHYGAASQDVLDTGMALQMKKGLLLIEQDVKGIIDALIFLSKSHRSTVMAGRTLQQLAAPITFGFKVAVWLDEIMRHHERLQMMKPRVIVGQFAGSVGTLASLGEKGLEVQQLMMKELELGIPDISWNTSRDRWAELISWMAIMASMLAKIANEITLLMRSEIAELSEPFESGRGASSTLAHKRNPISCGPVMANAHRLRELASLQVLAMIQEHERGALGQMHLEWTIIPDAFLFLSGSLHHTRFILENLWVDENNMEKNLNLQGGTIMSEAVMMKLAHKVGKRQALQLVYATASKAIDSNITFREAILADAEIMQHISEQELDTLLNPDNYIGAAEKMIESVIDKAEKAFAKKDNTHD